MEYSAGMYELWDAIRLRLVKAAVINADKKQRDYGWCRKIKKHFKKAYIGKDIEHIY